MRRTPPSLRGARALGLAVIFASACTTRATEVIVRLDTDAPIDRALTLRVTAVTDPHGGGDAGSTTWVRGGPLASITLPATFALVPAAGGARDAVVALTIDAQLAPGDHGEPALAFQRGARFAFTPGTSTLVSVFLSVGCGAASSGCTTPGVPCTLSRRCAEQGLTCGDEATCIGAATVPIPLDPDADVLALDVGLAAHDASDASAAMDATDVPGAIDVSIAMDVPPGADAATDAVMPPPDHYTATNICTDATDLTPADVGDTRALNFDTCGAPNEIDFGCNPPGTPEIRVAFTRSVMNASYTITVSDGFVVGVMQCPSDCHSDLEFGTCSATVSAGGGATGDFCVLPVERMGGGCGMVLVQMLRTL